MVNLLAGFMVSALQWQMPSPLARTVTLFAQASAALSLFVIGGSLAGLHIAGLSRPVAQIAIGKLLVHPAAMLGALLLCEAAGMVPMDPKLRIGVVLTAASPMFGIYPILAQKHGHPAGHDGGFLLHDQRAALGVSAGAGLGRVGCDLLDPGGFRAQVTVQESLRHFSLHQGTSS